MFKHPLFHRIPVLFLMMAVIVALVPVQAAHAANLLTVTSTADGTANAANCPGANCRLRDAVAASNSGDTINFAVAGTITLTQGQLLINNDNVTITGPGASQLTIDANNLSRVFYVSFSTVSISGLTLKNGLQNDGNSGADYPAGGAILGWGAHLTMDDMLITGNTVNCTASCTNGLNGSGGAIALGPSSSLTITNSTISNNTTNLFGGGIAFNSGTAVGDDVNLTNVTISGNHVTDPTTGSAGGLSISYAKLVNLTNVLVSNNVAAFTGGGMQVYSAQVSILDSKFDSNQANGSGITSGGGAIYMSNASNFDISHTVLTGNTSTSGGGAVLVNTGTASIHESTIENNTASDATWGGGGIVVMSTQSLKLYNSLVDGNTTPGSGGGVWLGGSSTMNAWNDTFTANTDGNINGGGGIFSQSATLNLYNSTIFGNTATSGHAGGVYLYSGTVSLVNDIISDSTYNGNRESDCGSFSLLTVGLPTDNYVRTNDTVNPCPSFGDGKVASPLVGPLQDNGGPTRTMDLLTGSPAIDTGTNVVCADAASVNNFDQRGFTRPVDGDQNSTATCDLGAVEFQLQAVTLNAGSLNFGNQLLGSSAVQTMTLTNTGDHLLTFTSITTAAPFSLAGGSTCPLGAGTLAGQASCTIQVKFSPVALAPSLGSVAITTDAASSPNSVALSGTGVAGTQLLKNPSFEGDANHDNLPDRFVYTNLAAPADGRDCAVKKTGVCSLRLTGNGTIKTAVQTKLKTGVAGDDFTFGLWSKAASVPAGSVYRLQVLFYKNSTLVGTRTMNFAPGTHVFKHVTGTFTAPGAYTKIVYKIIFKAASGTAWFDTGSLSWAP